MDVREQHGSTEAGEITHGIIFKDYSRIYLTATQWVQWVWMFTLADEMDKIESRRLKGEQAALWNGDGI